MRLQEIGSIVTTLALATFCSVLPAAAQPTVGATPVAEDPPGEWIDMGTLEGQVGFPRTLQPYTPFLVIRSDDGYRYWVDLRPTAPHRLQVRAGDRVRVTGYATTRPDVIIAVSLGPDQDSPAASPPARGR